MSDDPFTLFADRRRRLTLAYLHEVGERVPLDELVYAIAAQETERSTPSTHQSNVMISLLHHHLPLLTEAGLIDSSSEGLTLTKAFEPALLDAVDTIQLHINGPSASLLSDVTFHSVDGNETNQAES